MSIFQINRIFATMKKLILITGGQRSGKSMQAEKMALEMSPNPIYMATAHIWDDEFRERVRRHQERRGPEWTNIEEENRSFREVLLSFYKLLDFFVNFIYFFYCIDC